MHSIFSASFLLALSSYANAQFGPPSSDNPYGNDPLSGGNNGPFSGGFGSFFAEGNSTIVLIHAVFAAVAFALLFPAGGILIRLASFRGVWVVHGVLQVFAYIVFTIAFGLGVWIYMHIPSKLLNGVQSSYQQAHPIIGIIIFCLLFLQPWLGLIHHFAFKKHSRRVFWSYAHIWIGRIVITLGIINGGLGLQLSRAIGAHAPSRSGIIAYAVVAGVVYAFYIFSAIYGESKRGRAQPNANGAATTSDKREGRHGTGSDSRDVRYA